MYSGTAPECRGPSREPRDDAAMAPCCCSGAGAQGVLTWPTVTSPRKPSRSSSMLSEDSGAAAAAAGPSAAPAASAIAGGAAATKANPARSGPSLSTASSWRA
jgi:hypothetical protein